MKKIIAIFFIFILLMSNAGLTMAIHFCGGQAVLSELTIGHNHLECGMEGTDRNCEGDPAGDINFEPHPCCQNEFQTMEVDEIIQSTPASIPVDFIVAYVSSFLNISIFPEDEKPDYVNYSPPLLIKDIPVLNEVFII